MLLLVASAVLIALVLIGGYEELAGATLVAVAYVVIYLLMAYFVARWSRGVLPMAAGLAIIFTTFAAVAAPAWFARDKDGFTDPLMPAELLGLLVLVVIALQVLLIIFAMRGFQQEWNIEVEVRDLEDEDYEDSSDESAEYEAQEGEPGPDESRDDADEQAPRDDADEQAPRDDADEQAPRDDADEQAPRDDADEQAPHPTPPPRTRPPRPSLRRKSPPATRPFACRRRWRMRRPSSLDGSRPRPPRNPRASRRSRRASPRSAPTGTRLDAASEFATKRDQGACRRQLSGVGTNRSNGVGDKTSRYAVPVDHLNRLTPRVGGASGDAYMRSGVLIRTAGAPDVARLDPAQRAA